MTVKEIISNIRGGWIEGCGPEADVVVSSRIRVARNLTNFPFPHIMDRETAGKIIEAVNHALQKGDIVPDAGVVHLVRMSELGPVERQILVEKHLISPDLLNGYESKAAVITGDELISIMINEEDHLRIQCVLPGLELEEAWRKVNALDDGLEKSLDFAFSEQLGYLTACPTNVGTGLRASIMLHLPGLVMTNQLRGILATVAKLGLAVRGLYGEGTEAIGNLFQISNQVTLGRTEEEIINNILLITRQLLEHERQCRQALYQERREVVEDKVFRAYGLLKHARVLKAGEAMQLFSDLRLGLELNLTAGVSQKLINELMVLSRPAYLLYMAGKELSNYEMDIFRAEMIRNRL